MTDLSDGFGDDLSIEERIIANERLLKLKAAERNRIPEFWDDVLQEGRIVQWQVMEKRPEAAPAYISASMSNRIQKVINRQTWTGYESRHGRPTDPIRRKDRDSFDDPDFHTVASAAETLDKVIFAYHHGEILQALNSLTERQREYVYLRFWQGLTNPEIAARFEMSRSAVEREWNTKTKPALLEQLEHLHELVG